MATTTTVAWFFSSFFIRNLFHSFVFLPCFFFDVPWTEINVWTLLCLHLVSSLSPTSSSSCPLFPNSYSLNQVKENQLKTGMAGGIETDLNWQILHRCGVGGWVLDPAMRRRKATTPTTTPAICIGFYQKSKAYRLRSTFQSMFCHAKDRWLDFLPFIVFSSSI